MALAVFVLAFVPCSAQILEQVVLYTQLETSHGVVRFGPRLEFRGVTPVSSQGVLGSQAVAVDWSGTFSIPFDALNLTTLVRMDRDGMQLSSVQLGDFPVSVAASATGAVYALTRIPLTFSAPLYKVDASGTIQWASMSGPDYFDGLYAEYPVVLPNGRVWIGGDTHDGPQQAFLPRLVSIDTSTGAAGRVLDLPKTGPADTFVGHVVASPDGTMWSLQTLADGPPHFVLVRTDGIKILSQIPVDGGWNGIVNHPRVDAAGDVWCVSSNTESGFFGSHLRKYSPSTGGLTEEVDLGLKIVGFALGASGESVYFVSAVSTPPFTRRLGRLNLVSGVRSSVPFEPSLMFSTIPDGDPTGFIHANVVDQLGDNDGDGATNRAETLAGSSPFDPLSRPEGPKVYVSFTASNAIALTFEDPDGLLDPAGGLDVGSISVKAGPYGEIFPILLSFLTFVQVSPDLTEATAVFGALPLASGSKLPLDVSVADRSGAVGWDWQVTPPGDL